MCQLFSMYFADLLFHLLSVGYHPVCAVVSDNLLFLHPMLHSLPSFLYGANVYQRKENTPLVWDLCTWRSHGGKDFP